MYLFSEKPLNYKSMTSSPTEKTPTTGGYPSESLAAYRDFRQRLDGLIANAWAVYQDKMACKAGCFSCCRNDFRISLIEGFELRQAFQALPPAVQQMIMSQRAEPERTLCPLLVDGQCSVYESRPVLCRIFGFPVSDGKTIATCELNFTDDRTETFTAKAFDTQVLSETTQAISALYLTETGKQAEHTHEPPPMFRIEEVLQAFSE